MNSHFWPGCDLGRSGLRSAGVLLTLLIAGLSLLAFGLAADAQADGSIFWSNTATMGGAAVTIGRAGLDGAGSHPGFITGAEIPLDVAVSASATPPKAGLHLGAVRLNRRKGTATLTARVSGPGKLTLSGKGVRRMTKSARRAGPVKSAVRAAGKAKRKLAKKGKVRLKLEVAFRPATGKALTRSKRITLKKKRRRRAATRALSEAGIHFVTPQTGPAAGTWVIPDPKHDPGTAITSDSQPLIGVEATRVQAGERLGCSMDASLAGGIAGPPPPACGQGLPGCSAALCGSFRPSQPLSTGDRNWHTIQAFLVDSGGGVLDQKFLGFKVDRTPPSTKLQGQIPSGQNPFRPGFSWRLVDDDFSLGSDNSQCSVVAGNGPPKWQPCRLNGSSGIWRTKISHKRRKYRFEVRGVDAFGRPDPTPAKADFNPVPCKVKASRVSLGQLLARGLPVRVSCQYAGAINVRFVYNNSTALENNAIGWKIFTGSKGHHWTEHARLKVKRAKAWVGHQGKLPIRVIGVPGRGLYSGGYGKATSSSLLLRR